MSEVLKEVLAKLPKLTEEEVNQVLHHIAALRSLGVVSGKSDPSNVDLVLVAVSKVLRESGLEYVSPDILRKSSNYKSFTAKVPGLMEYIDKAGNSKVAKQAVLELGVELLHKKLSNRGYSVGSRLLLNYVHLIPSVINQQFPGYAESGMLPWIAKQEERNKP